MVLRVRARSRTIQLLFALSLSFFLAACSDDGGDGPDNPQYGVTVSLAGAVSWDATAGSFSTAGKADAVNLLTDADEGISLDLLDALVIDQVARLKTQIKNLDDPVDEMVDVTVTVDKIEGQAGAEADGPWHYGTIANGKTSDTVEWRISGLDTSQPFTIHFTVTWRREAAHDGPDELVVTGDYANAYYLVDPFAKQELAKIDPFAGGDPQPVESVTLGYLGERVYFVSKAAGVPGRDIYATDTMSGENTTKLTSMEKKALENLDANPRTSQLVFEADVDAKTRIFLLQDESATPLQISGDEQLIVPHADDPTVSWGDSSPAWSPDGRLIAYARASKDTEGSELPLVNTVVVMNPDGSGKIPLYGEVGAGGVVDLCWTFDSEFVIFTMGLGDADSDKKVYAVHQRTGTLSDLTDAFKADENGVPAYLWCSPSQLAVVYAPVAVNPDLYLATFTVADDELALDQIEVMATGQHFREPDWAVYRRSSSTDVVGSYGSTLPAETIATADYADRYYLVDAASGVELLAVAPGLSGIYDVSLGASGERVFFVSKPAGASGPDLYACDTLTGDNVKKLTSFNAMGLANPDASPTGTAVVFEAVAGGGTPHLYTIDDEQSQPVKISGDETLVVPEADDPTESWGDTAASWSPDGTMIAYNRASKDTTGGAVPLVNAVVVMNADGTNKEAIWGAASGGATHPCWTHDGQFVIFTQGAVYARDKKVYAVHVASKEVSELTASFAAHAKGAPATLWCAPSSAAVVYAPIEVNPDLYTATLEISDNTVTVGTIQQLTEDRQHYRDPDWAAVAAAP